MQHASESIAALAAALATAQCELTNPVKSLVGTIKAPEGDPGPDARSTKPGTGIERSFRYASLASGLDIVRKALGQHQIAAVQMTAIDQAAGTVNLTTVLAHASGEWISSEWPVCRVADAEEPHRMGAALTYARRYGLFTLVGIAGEDDLDAPDLLTPAPCANKTNAAPVTALHSAGQGNGIRPHPDKRPPARRHGGDGWQRTPTLAADASALIRDRLITELNTLANADDAALWAKKSLPQKDQLTAADAKVVEEAFQAKLQGLTAPHVDQPLADAKTGPQPGPAHSPPPKTRKPANGVNKSLLALPEPRRIRDKAHLKYVAQQPCLICDRRPCDAHHLRFAQNRALGRKVSDEFTVPLCRGHHRELHNCGDEPGWWSDAGIEPLAHARTLWLATHPLREGARPMPTKALAAGHAGTPHRTKRSRASGRRGHNNDTKPIAVPAAQP